MAAAAADPEAALYGLLVDTTLRQLADTQQQARLYVNARAGVDLVGRQLAESSGVERNRTACTGCRA